MSQQLSGSVALVLVLVVLAWGTSFPAMKHLASGMMPGLVLFFCYLFQVEGQGLASSRRNAFIAGLDVSVLVSAASLGGGAALFGFFWQGEAMTGRGWLGAALLISGMIMSQWNSEGRPAAALAPE